MLDKLLRATHPQVVHTRSAQDVWSPLEYAAHVSEAVSWYLGRIRRVLDEELPLLNPFDFDAAAELGEYHRRSVDEVVAAVRAACRDLSDLARSVSDRQLSRCGLGSNGSPRSVAQLLARAEHELVHHELDLRRGLGLVPRQ